MRVSHHSKLAPQRKGADACSGIAHHASVSRGAELTLLTSCCPACAAYTCVYTSAQPVLVRVQLDSTATTLWLSCRHQHRLCTQTPHSTGNRIVPAPPLCFCLYACRSRCYQRFVCCRQCSLSESLVTARATDILEGMILRGFTTVRDCGK